MKDVEKKLLFFVKKISYEIGERGLTENSFEIKMLPSFSCFPFSICSPPQMYFEFRRV